MIYLYIGLLALLIILSALKEKSIVNPIALFAGIWLVTVLLYQLRLSIWQERMATNTYLVLMLVTITYSATYFLSTSFSKKTLTRKKPSFENHDDILNQRLVLVSFCLWGALGAVEVLYSKGIPLVWLITESGKTYSDYGIPTLHGILNAMGLTLSLILFKEIICNNNFNKLHTSMLAIIVIYYIMLVTRQVLMSMVIEGFIVLAVKYAKSIYRMAIPAIVIGTLLFGLMGNLRTGFAEFMRVSGIKQDIPAFFAGLYWVYMYLTMTIANINNMVLHEISGYGANAIVQFLPSIFRETFTATDVPSVIVNPAFTVSGFFADCYVGFGILGAFGISMIYGIVGGLTYDATKSHPRTRNELIYAVSAQIILLSIFDNMLLYLPNSFQIIFLMLFYAINQRCKSSLNLVCTTKEEKALSCKKEREVCDSIKEPPPIEIIMAVYNGEKYLKEQIESIQNQSYKKWHLLISDDNSTDQSYSIMERYARTDSRIECIRQPCRQGSACHHFMALLMECDAQYLMFADQDDIWSKEKISLEIKRMNKIERSNTPVAVCTDLIIVDESLQTISNSFVSYQKLNIKRLNFNNLLSQNVLTGCTILLNRPAISLIKKGYRELNSIIMHDRWVGLVVSAFGKISFIEQPTVLYRQHLNNSVGARKFSVLSKIKKKQEIILSVKKSLIQAEAFVRCYGELLDSKKGENITNYINIRYERSAIRRVILLFKSKALMFGVTRKIAQIASVAIMPGQIWD